MATDINNVVTKGALHGSKLFKDVQRGKQEISNTALVVVKGFDCRHFDEMSLDFSSTATSTATAVCQIYFSNADAPSLTSVTSDWRTGGDDIRFLGGSSSAKFSTSNWKWALITGKNWRSAGTATTATGKITIKAYLTS